MGLFTRKKRDASTQGSYVGRMVEPFIFKIPEDWEFINDNGVLRANKDDLVRLSISVRDMSSVPDFTLDALFETVKSGYFDSDFNWGAYSDVTKKDDYIFQTLEYLDDPRLIIAVVEKNVDGKLFTLIISFAGNSGSELEMHSETFMDFLGNIEVTKEF